MRSKSLIHSAAWVFAILGLATVVEATPITYVQSGIASGMIGGSAFTNALVQVTVTGDTANVVSIFAGTAVSNPSSLTTVTIAGVGTATVTDPSAIFSSLTPIDIDPGNNFPILPYVIIGTLDNPPSLESFTGIGGTGDNALLGYNLQTSIGPLTAIPGGVGYPTGLFVHTTLGNLSFTSNVSPTFQGTFTATVGPVPEPSSLLLLGSAIAVLVARSHFRTRG